MITVNIHQAKTNLSQLIASVEAGEEVVLARNGEPVARLTAITPAIPRAQGAWRAMPGWQTYRYDPAVFAPMTDAELEESGWA